jgi:hypothetical protein
VELLNRVRLERVLFFEIIDRKWNALDKKNSRLESVWRTDVWRHQLASNVHSRQTKKDAYQKNKKKTRITVRAPKLTSLTSLCHHPVHQHPVIHGNPSALCKQHCRLHSPLLLGIVKPEKYDYSAAFQFIIAHSLLSSSLGRLPRSSKTRQVGC